MAELELSDRVIDELPVPAKGRQADYYDTAQRGLVLRVNGGSGVKVWRASFTVKSATTGRSIPTTRKIGVYPVMRTAKARRAVLKVLGNAPKTTEAVARPDTFGGVVEEFIKRHVDGNKDRKIPLRSKAEIERVLNKYVLPFVTPGGSLEWRHRPIGSIRRSDVTKLLDHIEDNHGGRQCDYVLSVVRKLFNWHATRDDDFVTPIVKGMARTNPKARERKRVIGMNEQTKEWDRLDELRALWTACDEAGTFGALVKVALLTGQRKDKVATMTWADIEDGAWTIPSEPGEKGHAGFLRLPRQVLDIIAAQPRIAGNPYVFPGRGTGPFNSFSEAKAELDKKLPGMPHWQIHDLRRTARSLMARAGVDREIAERTLGHTIRGVEGTYNIHSYSKEKAGALEELAALVDRILNPPPANVEQLEDHRPARSAATG